MTAPRMSTVEMRRLYEVEKLNLRQIAEIAGISHQAVHRRLKNAGVPLKKRKQSRRLYDIELIRRLYIAERMTIEAIGKKLRISNTTVSSLLKKCGVRIRKPREWARKYREFETLGIGESITIPKPRARGQWHGSFYKSARRYGIRISVRKIDDHTIELIRVA